MGKVTIDEKTLDEIGKAIIDKGGATAPMKPGEMAYKINEIQSAAPNQGGIPDEGWKNDGASHFWNYGEEDGWTFQIDIGKVIGAPITIAWGDGQSDTLNVSSSNRIVQHVYAKSGAYRVDVTSGSGGSVTFGAGSASTIAGINRTNGLPFGFSDKYTHIELGSNADQTNGYSQCAYMTNLIGFKAECEGAESQAFMSRVGYLKFCDFGEKWSGFNNVLSTVTVKFKTFTFPKSATSANSAFYGCYGIEDVYFEEPSSLTTLNATFRTCSTLKKCFIPSSVESIEAFSFYIGSSKNVEIHFRGTIPPTVTTSSAFNLHSTAKIYVPYSEDHSVLTAYKAAPNLSVYADQIYEEEES